MSLWILCPLVCPLLREGAVSNCEAGREKGQVVIEQTRDIITLVLQKEQLDSEIKCRNLELGRVGESYGNCSGKKH